MSILKHAVIILILMSAVEGFSQWIPTASPVETEKVYSITKNTNYWFAGTLGTGVYRRGTNDTCWVPKNRNLSDVGIEFMGANDNYVFAVSNENRMYRSSNNGDDWEQLNHSGNITSFLCYNDTLLISASNGLRVSYNNGDSWSLLSSGFGSCYNIARVNNKIYVPRNRDIYLSSNNGANWSLISSALPTNENARCFGAGPDAVMTIRGTPGASGYTRIYRSTNDGITWDFFSVANHPWFTRFFYENGYYYFTLTSGGIFRSSNAGTSWTHIYNGLPPGNGGMENVFADSNEVLTGGVIAGMYRSTNFGTTWNEDNGNLSNIDIDDMYHITNGLIAKIKGIGLYKTTNYGVHWERMDKPMSNGREIDIIGQSENVFYGILNRTFYKSTDNSNTWAMVSGSSRFPVVSVKEYLFNSDELYIATENTPHIYRSVNGGVDWTEITANYPESSISNMIKHSGKLYAGDPGGGGVLIFDAISSTWSAVNSGLTDPYIKTIHSYGGYLYAGSDAKIFRSSNNGQSWNEISGPIEGHINVIYSQGNYLMCGSSEGFYYSKNAGNSWNEYNIALTNKHVTMMQKYNSNVFIALKSTGITSSQGIWHIPIEQITVGISSVSSQIPEKYTLHQNYPNPFNPETRIKFEIPKQGIVSLKVYDITGKEVANLVNEELNAGIYEYDFNGDKLSSGMYFYRLETDSFIETKKMVLVK